jgi:hypothetical protein
MVRAFRSFVRGCIVNPDLEQGICDGVRELRSTNAVVKTILVTAGIGLVAAGAVAGAAAAKAGSIDFDAATEGIRSYRAEFKKNRAAKEEERKK